MQLVSTTDGVPGVIAIGASPVGIIAVGGTPLGVISMGATPVGLIAIGFFVPMGLLSVGFVGSYGVVSIGGMSVGLLSYGGGICYGGYCKATGSAMGGVVRGVGGLTGIDQEGSGSDTKRRIGEWTDEGWRHKSILASVLLTLPIVIVGALLSTLIPFHVPYRIGMTCIVGVAMLFGTPWVLKRESMRRVGSANRKDKRIEQREAKILAHKTLYFKNDWPHNEYEVEVDLGTKRFVTKVQKTSIYALDRAVVRFDPRDLDNYEVLLDSPTEPLSELDAPIAASDSNEPTINLLDKPFWAGSLKNAETWLFGPRGASEVLLMPFYDPHHSDRNTARLSRVDSASHLLAEYLWAHTDARPRAGIWMFPKTRQRSLNQKVSYSAVSTLFEFFEGTPVALWGEAEEHLGEEGYTLRIRFPGESSTRAIGGPLHLVAESLVDELVERGICNRNSAPDWYAAPFGFEPKHIETWRESQGQAMAGSNLLEPYLKMQHLPPLMKWKSLAEEGNTYAGILYLVAAIYMHRALPLRPFQLEEIEKFLLSHTEDHVLRKLLPTIAKSLGLSTNHIISQTKGYREQQSAYDRWLQTLQN